MKIFKKAYNGSFFIEGLREFSIGGYTPTIVGDLVYITNNSTGTNILDSVSYQIIEDAKGNTFVTGSPELDKQNLLAYLVDTIVENKPLRMWSKTRLVIENETTDIEIQISGLLYPPVFEIVGENYSQSFKEEDLNLEQLSPFVWVLKGFAPQSNSGKYDLKIETDSFTQSFEEFVDVISSPFIDLRLGGATLGRIESRANYLQPVLTQTLETAGLTRDSLGIRNSSGFTTWSHWVKFHDVSEASTSGKTISMVVRVGSSVWMAGLFNNDPHVKNASAQYYQAQIVAYLSNNLISRVYGGGGVSNWSQVTGQNIVIGPGDYLRFDFENTGNGNSLFTIYRSGPNAGDWLDTSDKIFEFTHNSPGVGLQRIPGAVMRNSNEQQYIVAIGSFDND